MKSMSLALGLSLVSHFAFAGEQPNVQVKKINFNGSGCPLNSGVSHHWENGELVLNLVDFVASRYDGSPLAESRKNCMLTLVIATDDGYSYSLSKVSGKGYVDLKAGTQAVIKSAWFFEGNGAQSELGQTLKGPYAQDYAFGADIGLQQVQWSPCHLERALNVNTSARITQQGSSKVVDGFVSMDELRFGVQVRACQ